MPNRAERGQWVQIVAPWQRDAANLADVVSREGYRTSVYPNLAALAEHVGSETGVVILTQEALDNGTDALQVALERQPAWSDIPFVVLHSTSYGRDTAVAPLPHAVLNRIELERPIGAASLLSAVGTAMRSRQKQFEVRDRMDELAASQKALAESEAELRRITDALPVLIAFVDTDFRYRFANKAYHTWFGIDPKDMLGKTVEQVFGSERWEVRKEAMQQAMAGHAIRVELPWPHANGKRRVAEFRYIPRFQPDGRIDGVHLFASDITERKEALEAISQAAVRLEQKVAERTAELRAQMQARSESEAALRQAQKMEAVGQLTGGIAHDFNNMLTSIIGALDVVGMRVNDERTARIVRAATESAGRAAALTQRLLAFSRRQSLDPKPVEINELIQSMHMLLVQTVGERITMQTSLAEGLGKALVDANQLESAVLNLCINARDAMPDGGRLRIATRHAPTMPFQRKGEAPHALGYVVVEVSDNGVGMDPAIRERVFEPFFTTKPLGQGTGLGLSMIYGFMQQSKGFVDLQSTPGGGTTISLYLPVAPPEQAVATAQEDATTPPGHGQLILLVEDDDQVRLLVSYLLEELGYAVVTAVDATAAMSHVASLGHLDLLISDVGLPGMNGRQLAELIREEHPSVPVLFMTGYAENAAVRSEFLGPNMSIIAKPFALDDFGRVVRRVLHHVE
ncbi:PAS/PAC sensor hybrid histidine kinase [Dyella jiangningensis]|uniref:hybrid sensor histidine kinase/response regulator n=1 Tax=Dyella sp. AtDHG13 TaxID=1938897 RepID=UPI000891874D|nr:PAS domain-containing sensor histidine kinase [Dyella sp. AtDHG13]PXV55859.1 PAS/PAC sensor hybrid histidine kinase [Dyella sp. AtDHG13]SDK53528.1 PAS/PAC sensor hybrid histidine kinase [Dyella jiangningensis]